MVNMVNICEKRCKKCEKRVDGGEKCGKLFAQTTRLHTANK